MKKSAIHIFALFPLLWGLSGCKQDKVSAAHAATTDSAVAVNVLSATDGSQAAPEQSEPQGGMYKPADVEKYWKTRTINVPGHSSDIVALFEAFYAVWPTEEGNRIVHITNPALAPDDTNFEEGSEIDRKNGYVESAWYENEDGPDEGEEEIGMVTACVWKRKNGHKLFAVNFGAVKSFLCFYDYDPDKRTLTPEESPIKKEHLYYPDKKPVFYTLPHHGKTLEVVEDAPGDEVVITRFTFDGQNLVFAGHE